MYNGVVKKIEFVGVTSDVALNMLTMTAEIFEEAWSKEHPDTPMNFALSHFALHAGIGEVVIYTASTNTKLEAAALVHNIPHMFEAGGYSHWIELIGGTPEAQAAIMEELDKEA